MRKYKWGILAPGTIANKFAEGLKAIPNAVLYAVGSRDMGRAKTFAEKHGFEKTYGSYRELAEDPNVDIIYVATPHPQHEEAAILCIENGKAVICEKPFAVNAAQVERMIQCARKKNIFLMEAMWTRFLPTVCKARELIKNGAIGNVRLVNADFGFRTDIKEESRLFALAYAGGSLLDVGIYNLSMCSMIYGEQPERIQAHMVKGSTGADEETSLLLSYKGGQSAQLYSAIRLNTMHEAMIIGENGRIELPDYWHGKKLKLINKDGVKEFDLPFEASGYQFEALEVMRCLEEGKKESSVMPLEESLAIVKTMDRIRKDCGLRYPCD
jgi:predicted dehydrogenase